MIYLTVFLLQATLCINHNCYPALVNLGTPTGIYFPYTVSVPDPLYRGTVLKFAESNGYMWSIHRLWEGVPKEQRPLRLQDPRPDQRYITRGCINVSDSVYDYLERNCGVGQCELQIVLQ